MERTSLVWFSKYEMHPEFRLSHSRKSLFCVSFVVYNYIAEKLGSIQERHSTIFRIPSRAEVVIGAFLHYLDSTTFEETLCPLEIGRSRINDALRKVPEEICDSLKTPSHSQLDSLTYTQRLRGSKRYLDSLIAMRRRTECTSADPCVPKRTFSSTRAIRILKAMFCLPSARRTCDSR